MPGNLVATNALFLKRQLFHSDNNQLIIFVTNLNQNKKQQKICHFLNLEIQR